jgi:hypothetical protein
MKSPFPGMDPFIESQLNWADFHSKLIAQIDQELAVRLPPDYRSKVQERSYLVLAGVDGKDEAPAVPDVTVLGPAPTRGRKARGARGAEEAEAVTILPFIEEAHRELYIEVHQAKDEPSLVAAIEVLSPTNKAKGSEGWTQYLRKRNAMMLASAHFVEVDLLRGGSRMPMAGSWPDSPYYVLLCRKPSAPSCRVWKASYRAPLPDLRVPLARRDPDIVLPLQALVDRVFQLGRYGFDLDYTRPAVPRLPTEDMEWLVAQMRKKPSSVKS